MTYLYYNSTSTTHTMKPNKQEIDEWTHMSDKSASAYWSANIRLITICMVIWALVSFGFGIILRPLISGISVGGTDLGFWFAQQGSILTFIVLVFFYAFRMKSIDRDFGVDEQ